MRHRIPEACYICCSNQSLHKEELTERLVEFRMGGAQLSETDFSLLICPPCLRLKRQIGEFQGASRAVVGAFFAGLVVFVLLMFLKVLAPQTVSFLTAKMFTLSAVLVFVSLSFSYFLAQAEERKRVVAWLESQDATYDFPMSTWFAYAQNPVSMASGYPTFANPLYQQSYEKANPRTADREVRDSAENALRKVLLAIGALAIAVILGLIAFGVFSKKPEPVQLGPAAVGRGTQR